MDLGKLVAEEFAEEAATREASAPVRIGAAQAESFPFRWICSLEIARSRSHSRRSEGGVGLGPGIIGTGTLVGPRAVLTAAHVAEAFAPDGGQSPEELRISPGRAGGRRPFGTRATRRVILPAEWIADPVPGSPADFAIVIADGAFAPNPGHWSMPRAAGDDRGSRIAALPGWRPGHYKVNHSGYPHAPRAGFQAHWYSDTFDLGGVLRDLLFIDSQSRQGESGSPVWVTRDRSLGGRHLWAMVVSAPDPTTPGGPVREVEALIIAPGNALHRFIEAHRHTSR